MRKQEAQTRQWWSSVTPNLTVGIDLGDRVSSVCGVDGSGAVVYRREVATRPDALERFLVESVEVGARVVMEAGSHSPWVSRTAKRLGFETIVANPTELYGKKRRRKKNDRIDAEELARRGRADPRLLYPIEHRSEQTQADLEMAQARDVAVRVRATLINHVRGSLKPFGVRMPACSAESFPKQAKEWIPEIVRSAMAPLLEQIQALTATIRDYDQRVEALATKKYPETALLRQVSGVGALTAVVFRLVIEEPKRFADVRSVANYLGLCPRQADSGDWQPQLRISKAGDPFTRRLLVGSAHYILGPFGPDTDLRRWGLKLMSRGGKNAKKRAVVAVARKLAVLLLSLWKSAEVYEPLRQTKRSSKPQRTAQPARASRAVRAEETVAVAAQA
jgi:transposase